VELVLDTTFKEAIEKKDPEHVQSSYVSKSFKPPCPLDADDQFHIFFVEPNDSKEWMG